MPLKADLHTHTCRSRHPALVKLGLIDGLDPDEAMVRAAAQAGFDVYAITDHNVVLPEDRAEELSDRFGLVVVPGVELHLGRKEALLLGVDRLPDVDLGDGPAALPAVADAVHDAGGILVAQHPFDPLGRGFGPDAWGVFDAVEAINGLGGGATRERHWEALRSSGKPLVASSDGHWHRMLGYCWTDIDSRAGTVSGVLDAIRRGAAEPAGDRIPRGVVVDYYKTKYKRWAREKIAGSPLFDEHVPEPDGVRAR